MRRYSLENGLTVIEEKRDSDSITLQLTVRVGSNYENSGVRGISHFIEHMLFEGTTSRADAREISNEIESLGGEINAYTDNVRTCYYIKVPTKHFEKAADILSDMIINPSFAQSAIDKERQVILKEINIFNDEARYYQWILFQQALYRRHPARFPAYGTREDVQSISREDILSFFNRHYFGSNCILTVVGNAPRTQQIIKKYFSALQRGKAKRVSFPAEPLTTTKKISKVQRNIMNSYHVLGFKSVPRIHKDSYVLDVIQAVLGRGQSGKIFDEIRNKRGLAYEVGVHHEASLDFGFFSIYFSADRSKFKLIEKLINEELVSLSKLTAKELKEAKGYVEGKNILDAEDTHHKADALGYWELMSNAAFEREYASKIRKVTLSDIKRVAKKYFSKNYTLAVIEQKK